MTELSVSADGRVVRGPALVDLQVNGYAGVNFNAPPDALTAEGMHQAVTALRRRGVAAILPTLVTDAPRTMLARAAKIAAFCQVDATLAAAFPGLHIEGPFISPDDGPRGAHRKACTTSPIDQPRFLDDLQEATGGRVKLLTLAPEVPGAVEFIARAAAQGVVVALGHTAAEPADLAAAVRAGAKMSTHLGNGSHSVLPRLANYVQWQLAEDALAASFIADGIHMPLYTLKNYLRAKGVERSILVTDATLADSAPGRYQQGALDLELDEAGRVTLANSDTLAGSALTLDRAVLNVHRHCDVSLEAAWAMASRRPAELIGLKTLPCIEAELGENGFADVRWVS